MTGIAPKPADLRAAAFCAPEAAEVFASIVHPASVWRPDPFDVAAIHAPARDAFQSLLARAGRRPRPESGSVLLLLGAAGSGKTHLMRAFRQAAHAEGGYCGYLQMTSASGDYPQYILRRLVNALGQPYDEARGPVTGLARLARGLADDLGQAGLATRAEIDALRDGLLDDAGLAEQVFRLADFAVQTGKYDDRDLDLLRVLLFSISDDLRLRGRVAKWLRCEELAPGDRHLLGGLAGVPPDGAVGVVEGLARVIDAVHGAPLVLLIDQLEEAFDQSADPKESGRRFRRAVDAVCDFAANVPTCVAVVACLEDYYQLARQHLGGPKLDRLEHEPRPVRLVANRSKPEVEAILSARLRHLFESAGVEVDEAAPLSPFAPADVAALANRPTRSVLQWLHDHQARCLLAGTWVPPGAVTIDDTTDPTPPPQQVKLGQAWNDFVTAFPMPTLSDEARLAGLLADALNAAGPELPAGFSIRAASEDRFVRASAAPPANGSAEFLAAVCDKSTRSPALKAQVVEAAAKAGTRPVVLVRSTVFPADPKAVVNQEILKLVAPRGPGRRAVTEIGDWRAMQAFGAFAERHKAEPGFAAWQRDEKPLTGLASVRAVLDLDRWLKTPAGPASPAAKPLTQAELFDPKPPEPASKPEPVPPRPPVPEPGPSSKLMLGKTRGVPGALVELAPNELCRHMAFLGGPGSGKTTAALALVEQLLMRGVPAILVDRKGDLARYADPDAYEVNGQGAADRRALRDAIDVCSFTPGSAKGRPLALPVVPPDLDALAEADRAQFAQYSAAALWTMLGNKVKAQDPRLAILGRAIDIAGRVAGPPATLDDLRRMVVEQDDALLTECDGYEAKHYKALATELQTLRLTRRHLFEARETLDIDLLLGRGTHAVASKTRLSVVGTQFLGDPAAADSWVAQLLLALLRWKNKNPSDALQAVVLFDEADQYLPAGARTPASKGPMETLLKQARSAGLGVFLATQSPGDLDYKCRDQVRAWLVGRVKEKTALDKLRPTFEAKPQALDRLALQKTGEFHLARENEVLALTTVCSLVETRQVPEDRILELARRKAPA